MENKYRSRVHALLLYPEDDTHVKALEFIKRNYDYAYILHDRDPDDDGVIKKEHWHVVLRFKQAVWNTAISKEIGITDNYIEKARNFENTLQYLIHYNDSDKYQYSLDDVQGPLKNRLAESIAKQEKSEGEKVIEIIDYITSSKDRLTVTQLARYCAEKGLWSDFRRAGAIIIKIMEEHNNGDIQANEKDEFRRI